jgi:hypothetical protein
MIRTLILGLSLAVVISVPAVADDRVSNCTDGTRDSIYAFMQAAKADVAAPTTPRPAPVSVRQAARRGR